MRRRRGIILTDALLGLALVATTGALLSTTVVQHHKAGERLSASRASLRAAERVLSDLQLGHTPQASDERTRWEVRPLKAPAPRGQVWVEVRVVHRARSASLSGLVPAASVKGGSSMMIHRPSLRRGVMLVEMLVTIGVIGIFLVVAGKLFSTTLRLTHASQVATGEVATFESCVAALRHDAWSAAESVALAEGGVRIARGDGVVITWSADAEGALVRRADEASMEQVRRWPRLGARMSLHPDPCGVLVRAGDDELRLVSQVLIARVGAQ